MKVNLPLSPIDFLERAQENFLRWHSPTRLMYVGGGPYPGEILLAQVELSSI
jgi:hypothetical protein